MENQEYIKFINYWTKEKLKNYDGELTMLPDIIKLGQYYLELILPLSTFIDVVDEIFNKIVEIRLINDYTQLVSENKINTSTSLKEVEIKKNFDSFDIAC